MNNQDGLDAYWKEWTNLEAKGVYDYNTTCEWSRVSREARDQGKEVHLAFLCGFMVQKVRSMNQVILDKSTSIVSC